MSKIYNKVCVVTGGGNGIGRSFCETLAAAGARAVYVVDLNSQTANDVAGSLQSLATHPDFRAGFDVADVGKEDDIQRVILSAWKEYGTIDAYFSNAGVFKMGGICENEVSNEAWEWIWNINARHLFPLWKQNSIRGVFVVTGSAAGLLMQIGALPYHVTKHAAVSVADWLAVEHHQDGVSVHCVCPQAVNTDMLAVSTTELGENGAKSWAGTDGIAEPKDISNAALKGIEDGTFMILPHPQVKKYFSQKSDYDRWLKGMRRAKQHIDAMASLHRSKL